MYRVHLLTLLTCLSTLLSSHLYANRKNLPDDNNRFLVCASVNAMSRSMSIPEWKTISVRDSSGKSASGTLQIMKDGVLLIHSNDGLYTDTFHVNALTRVRRKTVVHSIAAVCMAGGVILMVSLGVLFASGSQSKDLSYISFSAAAFSMGLALYVKEGRRFNNKTHWFSIQYN